MNTVTLIESKYIYIYTLTYLALTMDSADALTGSGKSEKKPLVMAYNRA